MQEEIVAYLDGSVTSVSYMPNRYQSERLVRPVLCGVLKVVGPQKPSPPLLVEQHLNPSLHTEQGKTVASVGEIWKSSLRLEAHGLVYSAGERGYWLDSLRER